MHIRPLLCVGTPVWPVQSIHYHALQSRQTDSRIHLFNAMQTNEHTHMLSHLPHT